MLKIIYLKIKAFNGVYIFYNYKKYITIHFAIIQIYFKYNIYISLILIPVYNFKIITIFLYYYKY